MNKKYFVVNGNEFGWDLFEGKLITQEEAETKYVTDLMREDFIAIAMCEVEDNEIRIIKTENIDG